MKAIFLWNIFFNFAICSQLVGGSPLQKGCPNPLARACVKNGLRQIYANQNMCKLLQSIPKDLYNLSYATYPSCQQYNTARFDYNKRFNVFPQAIIMPRNCKEVIETVNALKFNNAPFAIRSGGHCLEGCSLSPNFILDLSNFNYIKPNVKKKTVRIGAGARLGTVIECLGKLDFAIPTGTCPSVGVAGLSLAGGIGYLGRQFGLTTDSIKSMRVLTADLQVIKVDAQNFSDLFWALRGAGSNSYGIVLDFTFNMQYIPKVSVLKLSWQWNSAQVAQIIKAWQVWIATLPNTISTEIGLSYSNGQAAIQIQALKIGAQPFTEWKNAFISLKPTASVTTSGYIEAAKLLATIDTAPFIKEKSKFLFEPFTTTAIQEIVNYFELLKSSKAPFNISFAIGAGRGNYTKGNTAFFARNAFIYFFQFANWNYQDQGAAAIASLSRFYDTIAPYTSPYSYSAIVDYELGSTYLNAYYGTNIDRLKQIKQKYDPTNVFTWHQGIPI